MPIVQPGQINLQQFQPQAPVPSFGERLFKGLGSGVQGIIVAMQEREKLEREKQEFESKQAYFATLKEGNELENEQKRRGLKKEERTLQARGVALDGYNEWLGGGAKPEDRGKITMRFAKDPEAAQAWFEQLDAHTKREKDAADAARAAAEAQVATETADERIAEAGTDAETSASNARVSGATEQTRIDQPKATLAHTKALAAKAIADAQAPTGPDESTIRVAIEEWKAGAGPIGAVYKKYGIPLPEGTDPNKKYEPQTRGMAVWKAQQKQSAVAALQANEMITGLAAEGVKISRNTAIKEKVPLGMGRSMIPEKEQQLLDASGIFVSRYTQSVSGLAATDSEREFISRQIAPKTGDKAAANKQKEIMREGMVQTMFDASQGAERPISEILGDVINAARAKGADVNTIKFFQASRAKALKLEGIGMKATPDDDDSPIIADDQPSSPDSLSTFMQNYGR
jgi:hypothetical protein